MLCCSTPGQLERIWASKLKVPIQFSPSNTQDAVSCSVVNVRADRNDNCR